MSEHAGPVEPLGTTPQDQLLNAAAVVSASGHIRAAAAALAREPLSEPVAAHIQALLTDPTVIGARRALAELIDSPLQAASDVEGGLR